MSTRVSSDGAGADSKGACASTRISKHAKKAGLSEEEWRKAVKFDSTDWGWVILSTGWLLERESCSCPSKWASSACGCSWFQP